MRSILVSIMALFTAIFLLLLGNTLLTTLLTLRGLSEGFSDQFLGLLTSVYFLGAFVATLVASNMIRRMGHIRCFTFCTSLVGISALAYLLLISPYIWLFIRFLTGFGIFVMYTVVESWLNGQTHDNYRSRVFSIYTLVNLLAAAASQQLLLVDSANGYILFVIASFLVTAAIMPVSWTKLQQPHIAIDMPTMSVFSVFKSAPVAVIGCLLSGLIMAPFWGLTPIFVNGLGYTENQLAGFISISILGGALLQYPVGQLSDKMDRRQVILMTVICAGLTALAMSICAIYFSDARPLITILSALFCGLVLAIYPMSVVHLVERINKEHLVGGSSALLMVYGIGSFIGPSIAGTSLSYLGVSALTIYYAVILGLFSVILAILLRRSTIVENPDDHESQYVAMVRTSPNVLPLHPESEEILDEPNDRRGERETPYNDDKKDMVD